VRLVPGGTSLLLEFNAGDDLKQAQNQLITTAVLGRAKVPNLPYENANGTPLKIDRDFLGKKRTKAHSMPGPFEKLRPGSNAFRVEVAGRGSS
jgi:alpha-N-arabinofuranosidase